MKKIVGLLLVCLVLNAGNALAAAQKIGVVNIPKVLNLSKAGKAAQEKMNEKVKAYQPALVEQEEQLKKLEEDFKKQAPLLSDDAKKEKYIHAQEQFVKYQQAREQVEKELGQLKSEAERKMGPPVVEIIKKLAKEEGFTAILEGSAVIYADEAIDITDRVIELFDAKQ